MKTQEIKYVFAVNEKDVEIISGDDGRFARLKIDVCSTEPNSHQIIFNKKVLQQAAPSLCGVPILAKFNSKIGDMEGHEFDEVGVGSFFNPKEIFVEEEEGITHIRGIAYLWKNYSYVEDVLEALSRRDGEAAVSMEIAADVDPGSGDVKNFVFQGVTILGEKVLPSIPSSHLSVLSFSELQTKYAEDFLVKVKDRYSGIDLSIPKGIKENAKKGLEFYSKFKGGVNVNALSIARYLSNEKVATPKRIRQAFKFLNSHESDMFVKAEPYNESFLKWMCYGGDVGLKWSRKVVEEMNKADKTISTSFGKENCSSNPYADTAVEINDLKDETKRAEEIAAKTSLKGGNQMEDPKMEVKDPAAVEAAAEVTPPPAPAPAPAPEVKPEVPEGGEKKQIEVDEHKDIEEKEDGHKPPVDFKALSEDDLEEAFKCCLEACGKFAAMPGDGFAKLSPEEMAKLFGDIQCACKEMSDCGGVYLEAKQELSKFKADVEEANKMSRVVNVLSAEDMKEALSKEDVAEFTELAKKFSFADITSWENQVKVRAYDNLTHNTNKEPKKEKKDAIKKFANVWDSKPQKKTLWGK